MSEEGEVTEEARKVSVSEKEGNNPYLSGESIIESVGIPKEYFKLNYNKSLDVCKGPTILEMGINPAAEISPESENAGSEARNEGATEIEDPEYEITKNLPL